MQFRMRLCAPTCTPENNKQLSTEARRSTRTPGERTLRITRPPEMMQPCETMESSANPMHAAFRGENKLRGRQRRHGCAQRPFLVVQIEHRSHGDQIHIGFEVGFERTYVAPVDHVFLVLIHEIVGHHATPAHQLRQHVTPEIVRGAVVFRVFLERFQEHGSGEQVHTHGGAARVLTEMRTGCALLAAVSPRRS